MAFIAYIIYEQKRIRWGTCSIIYGLINYRTFSKHWRKKNKNKRKPLHEVNGKDKLFKMKTKAKLNCLSVTVLAVFSTRISTCSPSLVLRNWLLLYISMKIIHCHSTYHFSYALHVPSRSCWRDEALHPNRSLAVKASLYVIGEVTLATMCCGSAATLYGAGCWVQWHWYFTHFKLFYFPIIIGFGL